MIKIQRWWRRIKSNLTRNKQKKSLNFSLAENSDIQNVNTESFATDYKSKKKVYKFLIKFKSKLTQIIN